MQTFGREPAGHDRRDVVAARPRSLSWRSTAVVSRAEVCVDAGDEVVAPARHDVVVDEWRDVLGRLQVRSSVSSTSPAPVERGIGREQQRHVDAAAVEGLVGERPTGVEGDDVAEGDAVHAPRGPRGTAGGWRTRAGRRRRASRRRVARSLNVAQPVALGRGSVDDEGVGVLGRRRRERPHREAGDRSPQGRVRRRRLRLRRARARRSGTAAPCRRTRARSRPGPPTSAGTTNSRGPRSKERSTGIAAGLEGLAVDLGQQLALGEVERGDDDGVGHVGTAASVPDPELHAASTSTAAMTAGPTRTWAQCSRLLPWGVARASRGSPTGGRGATGGQSARSAQIGRVRGGRRPRRARGSGCWRSATAR